MRVILRVLHVCALRGAAWCCVVLRGAAWCCVVLRVLCALRARVMVLRVLSSYHSHL